MGEAPNEMWEVIDGGLPQRLELIKEVTNKLAIYMYTSTKESKTISFNGGMPGQYRLTKLDALLATANLLRKRIERIEEIIERDQLS